MKRNRALTLIEILIAVLVVGIIFSALLIGVNFASRIVRHTANRTMALAFTQEIMEEIKAKDYEDSQAASVDYHAGEYTNFLGPEFTSLLSPPEPDDDVDEDNEVERSEFDDVDDYNGFTDTVSLYQLPNVSISAGRSVVIADEDEDSVLTEEEYGDHEYKIVTVTVSWTWQERSFSESVSTIITDHP